MEVKRESFLKKSLLFYSELFINKKYFINSQVTNSYEERKPTEIREACRTSIARIGNLATNPDVIENQLYIGLCSSIQV